MTNETNKPEFTQSEPSSVTGPHPGSLGYFVPLPVQDSEDEIKLLDIWRVLLRYKWLMTTVVFVSVVISVMIAFLITPVYRAEVLLVSAANESGKQSGIAALAGQFGGLAGLAGISVGGGGDIETAIATMKSRKFIARFITDLELKPILFEEQWDGENNLWIVNEPSLLKKIKHALIPTSDKRLLPGLAPGEPTPGETYRIFSEAILKISQDKKTQLVTVSVEWKNPLQAADWANSLVKRLNVELRQKTVDEAERSIDYLTEQINQTSLSELQNVLYRLIEEHTKVITLAKVNDEYVLKVIDPAVPPEIRSKPNRKLIVILGLFLGLVFGMFIAFILNTARNWREAEIQKQS